MRLLLLGVPAERIVCITYTKAAASEMRARVLSRLRDLLLMDEQVCRAEIEKLTGEVATLERLTLARGLFSAVLDSPGGGLQLTTIHGFCQSMRSRRELRRTLRCSRMRRRRMRWPAPNMRCCAAFPRMNG